MEETEEQTVQRGTRELNRLLAHFSGAIRAYLQDGDTRYFPDLMADIVARFPSVVSYVRLLVASNELSLALDDLGVLRDRFETVCDMGFGFQELYDAVEWIDTITDYFNRINA